MSASRDGGDADGLAPVIPLFGGMKPGAMTHGRMTAAATKPGGMPQDAEPTSEATAWHPTWTDDRAAGRDDAARDEETAALIAEAETALLKRLRTRSISEREAFTFLRDRDGELADDAIHDVLERMRHLGYLDDAALAEQLVHSGVERKGQGRAMLAQTLAKRGLARDVIDAALDELPDDEAERALEFARQKARSMRDLDRDTALRRLSGQLARRGYGAYALSAARTALDELGRPVRRLSPGAVRFE